MSTLGFDRLAGLRRLRIAPITRVSGMPLLKTTGAEANGVVVFSSGTWVDLKYAMYTAQYEEKRVDVNGTSMFDVSITLFIPDGVGVQGSGAVMFDNIDPHAVNLRYIALTTDNNGKQRLVGTRDEPLRFKIDNGTDERPGGRSGTRIVLGGRLGKRPPLYTG